MEIVFKRRLMNELLTTYLPSLLLLGITYATTYFKSFYFEAALTVNLTVMLVLTTLFIRYVSVDISDKRFCSVMEKLPSTSYVRLVDIWLICGQLIPFIEVILLTLRELYNEKDDENMPRRQPCTYMPQTSAVLVSQSSGDRIRSQTAGSGWAGPCGP